MTTTYKGFQLVYESQHTSVMIKFEGKKVHSAKNLDAAKAWIAKDWRTY